jgi:DivIVA domain-containing protein
MTSDDVRTVRFQQSWRGYEEATVDELLDQVVTYIDRDGRVPFAALDALKLPVAWRGYRRSEVDAFLERLRLECM